MFGETVRRHRERLGLTQEQLAERTVQARNPVSVRTIREIESGRSTPRPKTVEALADAFELAGQERADFFAEARRAVPLPPQLPDAGTGLIRAAAALAEAVGRQVDEEARRRQVDRTLLNVRWSWAGGVNPPLPRNMPRFKSNDLERLAATYMGLQSRGYARLAIIGQPGAGKTILALRLTRQLLRLCEEGEFATPVPVLLSLASWDPLENKNLQEWVAGRLLETYPGFGVRAGSGAERVPLSWELVRRGRVLPILDGLDEMPEALRAKAITSINQHLKHDFPLILTCRSDEYCGVVRAGDALTRATVLELKALDAPEVLRYLRERAPAVQGRSSRLEPILRKLDEEPQGPLAEALSTPLMVSLVDFIYVENREDPAGIPGLDSDAAVDRSDIENHLLDGFVPAKYPDGDEASRWTTTDAQRWLRFLARIDKPQLAWWELASSAPILFRMVAGGLAGLMAGVTLGLGMGIVFGARIGPTVGLLTGLVTGTAVGLLVGMVVLQSKQADQPPVKVAALSRGRIRESLMAGTTVGLVGGIAGWVAYRPSFGFSFAFALASAVGVVYGLTGPEDLTRTASPTSVLRRERNAVLAYGLAYGTVCGLAGILVSRSLWLGLAFGLSAGLAGGLLYGPVWLIVFRVVKREDLGARIGAVAWFHFTLTRLWFAASGQLPWRLMTFLNDACERDVLQQVGTRYQFRHARLRDRLRCSHH